MSNLISVFLFLINSFAEWLRKMRRSTLPSRKHEILRILLILFPVLGIEESYRCKMTSNRGELGAIGHSGGVIKSVVLSIWTYLVWGET